MPGQSKFVLVTALIAALALAATQGRAADLVSVLGNRPKALPRLAGDGVAVLEARLSHPIRTGA